MSNSQVIQAPASGIRQYFDRIAADYAGRYQSPNAYYRYFFNERLAAATGGIDFEGKTILDIGAGTGALYDFLRANFSSFSYFACDISPEMLAQSRIPVSSRFTGRTPEVQLPAICFDYIFLLGVSSYMTKSELQETLSFIRRRLSPGGKAVISFTHRRSLDFLIRRVLLVTAKFIWPFRPNKFGRYEGSLLAQRIPVTAITQKDIYSFANEYPSSSLKISRLEWQNQTMSPFNRLLPKASVFFARLLKRILPALILPFFSGDFLVVLEGKK